MTTRTKMLSDGLIIWLEAQRSVPQELINLITNTLAHIQSQDAIIAAQEGDKRQLKYLMEKMQVRLAEIDTSTAAIDATRYQKQLKKAEKKLLLAQGVIADLKRNAKPPEKDELYVARKAFSRSLTRE